MSAPNSISKAAVILGDVSLGEGNTIEAYAVLRGPLRLGSGNYIASHAVIGGPTRQRFRERPGVVDPTDGPCIVIGNGNLLFQAVTVHHPVRGQTVIGNNTSIGAHTHIAHDVQIGDEAIIAPHGGLGGYVVVGQRANLGLSVAVHPRVVVGAYAMLGMKAAVLHHVPPAATVAGTPARFLGPNIEGLERWGISTEAQAEMVAALGSSARRHVGTLEVTREVWGSFEACIAEQAKHRAVMNLEVDSKHQAQPLLRHEAGDQ